MRDLSAYSALADRVRDMGQDDDLTIRPEDFPATLADHLAFDGLAIDTSFIRSVEWGGEDDPPFALTDWTLGFEGFALPEAYRRFGLWLLHILFSGRAWAGLELTHPVSRARRFYVQIDRPVNLPYGLQREGRERFSGYIYSPKQVWRHPFADSDMTAIERIQPQDRPLFAFGWSDQQDAYRHNISKADQIILHATPAGIAAMAALMIDMAHPTLGRDEINLEPPIIGFAGTQPRSIEARFWLPGTVAFPGKDLNSLYFPPFR